MSDWTDSLQPASWRGVPFGVLTNQAQFGRRLARHAYPFRDKPWPEDLGRKAREFSVSGFLIQDSLVYGGGDVIAQRDAMIAAAEQSGAGTLVHPTMGELRVCLDGLTVTERWDEGRYFELGFNFTEAGDRLFPSSATSTGDAVASAATAADQAAASDYQASLVTDAGQAAPPLPAIADVSGQWGAQIGRLGVSATRLFNLAQVLPGNFGRFFTQDPAAAFSGVAANALAYLGDVTVGALAGAGAAQLAAVNAAIGALPAAIGLLQGNPLASAVQGCLAALLGAHAQPGLAAGDLVQLAAFAPVGPNASTPLGGDVNDLFLRATASSLARACAAYQPTSYDDAAQLRALAAGVLDLVIEAAGDAGHDASFGAFRALRVAVVEDLTARGANLAPIATFDPGVSLPALVLANRLYRDASRADQLVTQADPPHPLFMPPIFQALAA